ncbi:MAG: hypothetical protein K2X66_17070, partial [Cyanobacteria bacterium]|nr:hypothetical protein [Cyanobacteriota bacterium]
MLTNPSFNTLLPQTKGLPVGKADTASSTDSTSEGIGKIADLLKSKLSDSAGSANSSAKSLGEDGSALKLMKALLDVLSKVLGSDSEKVEDTPPSPPPKRSAGSASVSSDTLDKLTKALESIKTSSSKTDAASNDSEDDKLDFDVPLKGQGSSNIGDLLNGLIKQSDKSAPRPPKFELPSGDLLSLKDRLRSVSRESTASEYT